MKRTPHHGEAIDEEHRKIQQTKEQTSDEEREQVREAADRLREATGAGWAERATPDGDWALAHLTMQRTVDDSVSPLCSRWGQSLNLVIVPVDEVKEALDVLDAEDDGGVTA